MMLQDQCICDSWCVTRAKMLCGCLLEFEFWWIHQHLIPYVWQLVFAYISIQELVSDSGENCFFEGSGNVLVLSAHNTEAVNGYGVVAVMDRWGFICPLNLLGDI